MNVLSKQFLIILILAINTTVLRAPRPEFEKYDFEKAKEETRKTELKADKKRAEAFDAALHSGDLKQVLKEADKFTVDDWLTSLGKQSTLLQQAEIKKSFIANLEKTGKTAADYQKLTDHFDTWSKTLSDAEKLEALDKLTTVLNTTRQKMHEENKYEFKENADVTAKIPVFYEQIALASKLMASTSESFKNFSSDKLRQTIKSLNIALKKENLTRFNDLNTITILAKLLPDFVDSAISSSIVSGSKSEKNDLQNEIQKLLRTLFEHFPTTKATFNPNNASGRAMILSARILEKLFDNPALKITDKNLEKTVDQFINGIKQMDNNPGFDFLAFRFYMITEPQKLVEQLKGMSSKGREFALDSFAKKIKETTDAQIKTTLIKQLNEFITAITPKLLIYDPAQGTSHLALLALLDNHLGTIAPDVHTTIVALQKNALSEFIEEVPTSKKLTEENFITGAQNIIRTIENMTTKGALTLSEASSQIRNILTLAQGQEFLTKLTQDRVMTDTLKNLLKQANSLKNTAQSQYIASLISYIEKQALAPIISSIKTGKFDSSQLNQANPSMVRILLESLTNTLATEPITQAQKTNITTAAKALLEATLRNFTPQETQEFDDAFVAFFDKATEQINTKDAQELLQASFTANTEAPIEQLKIPELRLKLLLRARENINQIDKNQLVKILADAWPIAQNNEAARNAFLFLLDKINWDKLQRDQIATLAPIAVDAARFFEKFNDRLRTLIALTKSKNQQLLPTISTTILDMLNTHPKFISSPLDALRLTELKTSATTSLNTGIDTIIQHAGETMQEDTTSLNDLSKALKEAAKKPANQDALVIFISNMFESKPDFAKSTDTSDPDNARKKGSFLETLKTGSEVWDRRMEKLKPATLRLMYGWVETRLKDPKQIQASKPDDFKKLLTSMNYILSSGTEKGLINSITQSSPIIFEKAAHFEKSQITETLAEQFVTFAKTVAAQKPDMLTQNVIPALTIALTKKPTLAPDAETIVSTYISAKKSPYTPNEISSITSFTNIIAQQTTSIATTLTQQLLKTLKSPQEQLTILKQITLPAKEFAETFTKVLENQNLSNADLLEIARSQNLNETQLKTIIDRLTKAINETADIEILKTVSEKNPSLTSTITTQLLDIATRKNTTTQNTINIIKEALSKDLTSNQIDKLISALARPEILALPNILETVVTVSEKKISGEQKNRVVQTLIIPLYDTINRNDFSAIMEANKLAMRLNNNDLAKKQIQILNDYVTNTPDLTTDQISKLIFNSSLLGNELTVIKVIADRALKNNWTAEKLTKNITDKQTRIDVINQMLDQASSTETLDVAKTLVLLDNVVTNKDLSFDTSKFNAVLARTLSDPRSINIVLKIADKVTLDQVDNFIKEIINPLYEIASNKLDYQTLEQLGLLAVKPQSAKTIDKYMQLVKDFIKRNASSLNMKQIEEFTKTAQSLNVSDELIKTLASAAFETPTLLNNIPDKQTRIDAINQMLDQVSGMKTIDITKTLALLDNIVTNKDLSFDTIKFNTVLAKTLSDPGSINIVLKIADKVTLDQVDNFIKEIINPLYEIASKKLDYQTIEQLGLLAVKPKFAKTIDKYMQLVKDFIKRNASSLDMGQIEEFTTTAQLLNASDELIKTLALTAIQEKWSLGTLELKTQGNVRLRANIIAAIAPQELGKLGDKAAILQAIEKLYIEDKTILANKENNANLIKQLTEAELSLLNQYSAEDYKTMPQGTVEALRGLTAKIASRIDPDSTTQYTNSLETLAKIHAATSARLNELSTGLLSRFLNLFRSFNYEEILKNASQQAKQSAANIINDIAKDMSTWSQTYKAWKVDTTDIQEIQQRLNKIAQPA